MGNKDVTNLLQLTFDNCLDETLEGSAVAYHNLIDRFKELNVTPTIEVRGALLEVSAIIGDNPEELDKYIETYKAFTKKFGSESVPVESRIKASRNLLLINYLATANLYIKSMTK